MGMFRLDQWGLQSSEWLLKKSLSEVALVRDKNWTEGGTQLGNEGTGEDESSLTY